VSERRAAISAAILILAAGCTSAEDRPAPAPSVKAAPSAPPLRAEAPAHMDALARQLAEGRIVALGTLVAARGRGTQPGVFEAQVAPVDAHDADSPLRASLSLALADAPIAHRRPLAFYRLAKAIGARVVPTTVLRRVGVGELGALLEQNADLLAFLRAQASVQNDGTVAALLTTRPEQRAVALDPRSAPEILAWERWARAPSTAPGERPELTRDLVETLVLDYLAANVMRERVLYDSERGALVLDDNRDAFPLRPEPAALMPILERLRAVARFPKGLRDALARLDRATATSVLGGQDFSSRLLPPRALIDLEERRATLLSLLEAKIADRGMDSVLSL